MKTTASAFVLLAASAACAATIDTVLVRQQWPWHEKVRIDYVMNGNQGELADIAVTVASAGAGSLAPLCSSFSGDIDEVAPGEHVIWWDPAASGLDLSGVRELSFSLVPVADPQRYCVIDISDTNTPAYSVSYLAAPPEGGFNTDEYKKTKIVLKRVRAGTFAMGTPEDEEGRRNATSGNNVADMPQHKVTLTQDYWLGIFPLTLEQASRVNGSTLGITGTYKANQKPSSQAARLTFNKLLGYATSDNPDWFSNPVPLEGSWLHALASGISSGSLPAGTHFCLPTEAQWEYACRARTTTRYGNGTDSIAGIGPAYPSYHPMYPVGEYAPNAWGFYNMHRCIWQWTIDSYWYNSGTAAQVDPLTTLSPGSASGGSIWPALRGGTYGTSSTDDGDARSGSRYYKTYTVDDSGVGARIAIVYDRN